MSKKSIGYNDITKKFIYLDEETGLTSEGNGVLGTDKIEEIKNNFGIWESRYINTNSNEYKLAQKDQEIFILKSQLNEKDQEIFMWKERWIKSEKEYLELYEKFLKVKESKKCQK